MLASPNDADYVTRYGCNAAAQIETSARKQPVAQRQWEIRGLSLIGRNSTESVQWSRPPGLRDKTTSAGPSVSEPSSA